MSSSLVFLHLLVVVAGAFLIGVRAFRETHPRAAEANEDWVQFHRVARSASIALFLVLVGLILAADFRLFDVAKVIR